MGWSTRALGALASGLLALTTLAAAPAGADAEPRTLVIGVEGSGAAAALAAAGVEVVDAIPPLGIVEGRVAAATAPAAVRLLSAAPGISFVEEEHVVTAGLVPVDTFWSQQWGPRKIAAPGAWDITTGSSSVVVAVLDTGVTPNADLDGKLTAGYDFVNGDTDAVDDNGHGTSAAIVAAGDANDAGVAGICWTCRVMPVKVLDHTGTGGTVGIAKGITWAADHGADIITMSLGATAQTATVQQAVAYARSAGVILVAAAGNEGTTTPTYPAADAGVIGVAGSDEVDARYSWSNHGSWVDVAAPGCNGSRFASGSYGNFCGTSSATPVVAGVAALGLALGADADTVERALLDTAVPVGSWVAEGRVDAAATVAAVQAALAAPPAGGGTTTPEPTGDPAPATEVVRAAGDDRVGTSVALAQQGFPTGAGTVVLARTDSYADALAAAPLAATLGGPVLLTPGSGLRRDVADAVRRLGADQAVLVGGTGALSAAIERDLAAAGVTAIRRIAGSNRFDTARRIATEVGGSDAYVVEGVNASSARGWPDAVAVSGLAALQRRPILLTTADALPPETAAALRSIAATDVTIVGGTSAVSDTVRQALAGMATVRRVAGATRYDTSAKLASAALAAGADGAHVWLATGRSWPDALAAGPAAGALGAVLLLVDGTDLGGSPASLAWLDDRIPLRRVVLVGGTASVSSGVESSVAALGS